MERLLKAVENLLPFIHEDGMIGETDFERAVIELEKSYEAAQPVLALDGANCPSCKAESVIVGTQCLVCGVFSPRK